MGRLIDADELEARLRMQPNNLSKISVIDMVHASPTIEKRKTGKWVHGREIWREHVGDAIIAICYENWRCGECGALIKDEASKVLWRYCPWCGAEMEGAEE